MHYARPRSGEWVKPRETGYRMECCDCSLAHAADFMVVSDLGALATVIINLLRPRAMFRMFRDESETKIRRASRKASCDMAGF